MHTHEVVIRPGAEVVGPDGPLGTVAHVVVDQPTWQVSDLVLQEPDGHQWLIPASAVARTSESTVTLKSSWPDLGGSAQPYVADEFEPLASAEALHAAAPTVDTTTPSSPSAARRPPSAASIQPGSADALQLREEELLVHKQRRDAGAVELRKEVVTEAHTVEIPVWHEELIVEHQALDPTQPTDAPIGEHRAFRVVLREEVPVVDKQPVIAEEVHVGRQDVRETQHVEATVRREVADVREEGDVRVARRAPTTEHAGDRERR